MQARELAKLVKAMRDKQKEFFRAHEPQVLQQAKALERQVDQVIEKALSGQAGLFE
ncbi:MAG: hypothetical protein ABFD92_07710 [Planctomycetaceae bacterium]|nr:hypothetical protein [Planctomycetaceae bacterium]